MPPLDEGTLLDMPVTVPRASITQAADDLKARDALLRGFPEVESVIGKAGRADTPTDPSPLEMVETFVNFRPKPLWPKRVLKYLDAERHVREALQRLQKDGYLKAVEQKDDLNTLINTATQKAVERFDESMRELALSRFVGVTHDLETHLTRFAIEQVEQTMQAAGDVRWPQKDPAAEKHFLETMTTKLTPQFGRWLSRQPALEDVTRLHLEVASELHEAKVLHDVVGALQDKPSLPVRVVGAITEFFGRKRPTLAAQSLVAIETERTAFWHTALQETNWELFDRGSEMFPWYAVEELCKAAKTAGLLGEGSAGNQAEQMALVAVRVQRGGEGDAQVIQAFQPLLTGLQDSFRRQVFFWPRQGGRAGDLIGDEMERVLQVPGWSNIFTQPIINRVDMLSTGIRTEVGVKVFGPDLDTIDQVGKQIETVLKPINGARDVLAAPIMGKGYLQIDIDRQRAARYGISVEDIQTEIEVALAGRAVTYTVEKRDRFPVRIRYTRSNREDEESIRRLLIGGGSKANSARMGQSPASDNSKMGDPAGGTPSNSKSDNAHVSSPAHAGQGTLIPLSAVADVNIVEGPAMIKSENGSLLNYVMLNVSGRDIMSFVDEAQRTVAQKVALPEGVRIEWSGEFEHQIRAARTLSIALPVVVILIFLILYLTYNDFWDAALMILAVPEALAGGAFFMFLFPKIVHGWSAPPMDFSIAVWVGFIACFGMATETGIIMLVYLREAIEKRGGLEKIESLEELRQAVIEGAVHRLRPKLLTEGVAILAIFPMVFASGVGGEILAPMALPVLGGLLISDEVVDLFLPVRFYWVRRGRWLKLQQQRQKDAELGSVQTELVASPG